MSDLSEKVASLIRLVNELLTNGKKIDELPEQENLVLSSKIHVSNSGTSESLTIQKIIDHSTSINSNVLIAVGEITVVDNDITIPNAIWKISGVTYLKNTPTVINIPFAATNKTRIDVIYGNTQNQILRVAGSEIEGIAVKPNVPVNSVVITEITVTDSSIDNTPQLLYVGEFTQVEFDALGDVVYPAGAHCIVNNSGTKTVYWYSQSSGWFTNSSGSGSVGTLQEVTLNGPETDRDMTVSKIRIDAFASTENNSGDGDVPGGFLIDSGDSQFPNFDVTVEHPDDGNTTTISLSNRNNSSAQYDKLSINNLGQIILKKFGQAIKVITFQNKTGTVALMSDIPDVSDFPSNSTVATAISEAQAECHTYTDNAVADKADLVGGIVPSSQLPPTVDEILEGYYVNQFYFESTNFIEYTPESNKYYLDLNSNKTYRWSGTQYVPINEGIALGETSSTAYRGDRGKTAYDHSQESGNPHSTSKSDIGLGNVNNTSDVDKPVSTAQQAALALKQNLLNENYQSYSSDFINFTALGIWGGTAVSSGTIVLNSTRVTGNHPGVATCRSSVNANSGYRLMTDTAQLLIKGNERFTVIFYPINFSTSTFLAGWIDTTSITTPIDGVFVRYSGNGDLTLNCHSNSSTTQSATITTLSLNTWYKVVIEINANANSVTAYVYNESGTLIATSAAVTTNIPSGTNRFTGNGLIVTSSGTAVADLLDIDYMQVEMKPTR